MAIQKYILLMLLPLFCCSVNAQQNSNSIQGRIADSLTGENLSNATITLIKIPDSIVINQTVSNKNGFHIRARPGKYLLQASYIGYHDHLLPITLQEKDSLLNTGTLFLCKASGELLEVIVKAIIPPVIVQSDTIAYNTAAFTARPNATVEELLKKLPGIEVDKDGNITVQGEKIQKIYLDGKEFFFNDPTLASKNLPADLVDKIEVFNEKSERAKLTGIPDDHPAKVINLKLKPEKKKGMFGSLFGGYGSEGRYSSKTVANYFKGDQYVSGVANDNKGGNLESGAGLPNSQEQGLSVNYRNRIGEKLNFAIGYSQRNNNNLYSTHSDRKTFLPDSSLIQENHSTNSSKSNNRTFNLNMDYQVDSFNKVQVRNSLNLRQGNNNNNSWTYSQVEKGVTRVPLNDAANIAQQNTKSFTETISINYHHRFRKPGRYFGINFDNEYNRNKGNNELISFTHFYDSNGFIIDSFLRNQQSDRPSDAINFNLSCTYTEPVGKDQIIDFSYNVSYSSNHVDQQTFNYNPTTGKYDTSDSLTTNNFKSLNRVQNLSLGYNYFKSKLQYRFGISLQTNSMNNNNSAPGMKNMYQQMNSIIASGSSIYRISSKKNLEISYNGSSHQPSIEQLQPMPDYSNPLLIKLGNPGLKSEFANTVAANYRVINNRGNSFFSNFTISNTFNKIVNSIYTNTQGIQQQECMNTAGNYNLNSNETYSFPFSLTTGHGKGNANITGNLSYSQNINFVNGKKNTARSIGWGHQVQLNYHFYNRLFIDLSAGFNWNRSNYSLQSSKSYAFFAHSYYGDVFYELPIGLILSTNISLQFQNNQQKLPTQRKAVWNAALSQKLFFNQAGEVKLSIFDLLNNNSNFRQIAGENYTETNTTEVIKRVFVFSFLYRFRISKQ